MGLTFRRAGIGPIVKNLNRRWDLPEQEPGFITRWFNTQEEPAQPAHQELPVTQPTLGLCFDYERGLNYDSEYLSDIGLDEVMKVLQRYQLRATINCPARLCESAPQRIEAIVQAGHEIVMLGYANESLLELNSDALKQLVFSCRNAFHRRGCRPVGFRSARSTWNPLLAPELVRQEFTYSAEHDHAKRPYFLITGKTPLLRIPIRTDDHNLRSRREKKDLAISKHHRVVRKAFQGRYFVAVCFHPWILAEEPDHLDHWKEWLDTALQIGLRAGALEDVLPPEYRTRQENSLS